ncbi:DUF6069 family protein [Microbacterium sp. MPKO10]|uniref:DUF6069 family protein n=1 Tax=Microbacterium sp. MPKO10 TaxID=2989818 RepID=UPI00223545AF|nr:DUF6069 family protein [Microbacterium sp. MPKO10]MCW4459039.1 DUF6069 family protein [Microbacterium sp. MPKO10]
MLTSILAIVIAALAAELVWAIAVPLAGVELSVPAADMTVGPLSIAATVIVAGLAAWGLRAIMARTRRGLNTWTAIGIIVLLLSLAGPALSGTIGAVLSVLEIMHVITGVTLIIGLRYAAGFDRRRSSDA